MSTATDSLLQVPVTVVARKGLRGGSASKAAAAPAAHVDAVPDAVEDDTNEVQQQTKPKAKRGRSTSNSTATSAAAKKKKTKAPKVVPEDCDGDGDGDADVNADANASADAEMDVDPPAAVVLSDVEDASSPAPAPAASAADKKPRKKKPAAATAAAAPSTASTASTKKPRGRKPKAATEAAPSAPSAPSKSNVSVSSEKGGAAVAGSMEEFATTWLPWGPKGATTAEAWREWCDVLAAMSKLPFATWQRAKKAVDKAQAAKKRRVQKERDVLATMQAHAERISEALTPEDFAPLDNKWLADNTFSGALSAADLGSSSDLADLAARVSATQAPAATVYAVALTKGIKPLGIVSSRKNDETGKQLAADAVYVGRGLKMLKIAQTPFGEIAKDVKYVTASASA